MTGIRNPKEDLIGLDLVYNGAAFKDQHGVKETGQEHPFTFSRYDKAIEWDVKWYTFVAGNHPLGKYPEFKNLKFQTPHHQEKTYDLAYTWWRSPGGDVHPDSFGTFAKAEASFQKGKYLVQITSDDGLRFYVDGMMVIDNWNIHVPETDSVTLELEGTHTLEIEHFEGGGFSTLDFRIEPVITKRSTKQVKGKKK